MILVKGFSWEWAKHAWIKDNSSYTVKEISDWLKIIIAKEKLTSIMKTMPLEPPTAVPKRKENFILGTQCDCIRSLDRKYFDNEEDFRRRADQVRMEHEAIGEGSMYSLLQPFDRPNLKQVVDCSIDVLSFMPVFVDKELKSVGRWCKGKVLQAYESRKHLTVRVL